ncbi:MAG: flagellar FlbD family protein [Stackebrandtia sp.]
MITVHRLGHPDEAFDINPDLIVTVEAHPDTVVSLATGTRFLVGESADEVRDAVRNWRASVMRAAMKEPVHLSINRDERS